MHPNALLEHATELLHRVLQLKQPADGVVSDYFRAHRTLGSRERHTLAETTYAVLRKRLLWQHLAQSGKGELERRLAVLAWQGNDGFLRAASASDGKPGAEAIVAGQRCPLAGRVSMDLVAIDVTDLADAEVKRGDLVNLLGPEIGVDDLATRAGTIGYEVLTSLGRRYRRIYRG